MFIFNYLYSWLAYFGFSNKRAKLLFLGLDNAGKTTLLHRLKNDRMTALTPTMHATKEELVVGNITFTTFDLGGHFQARRVWKDYFPAVDAILFIVDVADHERFAESRRELDGLLSLEELTNVPFLVLFNKIDRREALSESDARQIFGLMQTTGKETKPNMLPPNTRPIEVFMCSIAHRTGYRDGFLWLSQYL